MASSSTAAGAEWWLLDSPDVSPSMTMALDRTLLSQAIAAVEPAPTVRLYRWQRPTLSVGAHTELPQGVAERCASAGVAVVRRPTGGGCVLHDGDLTYSVVAPDAGRGVLEAYRWVAEALIAGLDRLGIVAAIADRGTPGRPLNCFQVPTGADLAVGGRKLCGSAQLRRGGWFLQHGSIPIVDLRSRTAQLLASPPDDRSTFLECVKPGTTWEDLAKAIVEGFTVTWGSPPRLRPIDPELWHHCVEEHAGEQVSHAFVA